MRTVAPPIHQEANLTKHEEGVTCLKNHRNEYTTSLLACLRDRVKAQSTDLLTHTLTILTPQRWDKAEDASFGYEALDSLSTRFKVPLEKAKVNCSLLREEWSSNTEFQAFQVSSHSLRILSPKSRGVNSGPLSKIRSPKSLAVWS